MVRIAVCDDNEIFVKQIELYVKQIRKKYDHLKFELDIFLSSTDFVELLKSGEKYDIVFLDIKIPDLDGIEVGHVIRSLFDTIIVYMSVSTKHFVDLFEVKPFGFLYKPIEYCEFEKALLITYDEIFNSDVYFEFKSGRINLRIKFKDIIYLKNNKRMINLYTVKDTYCFYGKLSDVYKTFILHKFIFIHKSYIVNYNHISKIQYDSVIMSNNEKLIISERKRKEVRSMYVKLSEQYGLL